MLRFMYLDNLKKAYFIGIGGTPVPQHFLREMLATGREAFQDELYD